MNVKNVIPGTFNFQVLFFFEMKLSKNKKKNQVKCDMFLSVFTNQSVKVEFLFNLDFEIHFYLYLILLLLVYTY